MSIGAATWKDFNKNNMQTVPTICWWDVFVAEVVRCLLKKPLVVPMTYQSPSPGSFISVTPGFTVLMSATHGFTVVGSDTSCQWAGKQLTVLIDTSCGGTGTSAAHLYAWNIGERKQGKVWRTFIRFGIARGWGHLVCGGDLVGHLRFSGTVLSQVMLLMLSMFPRGIPRECQRMQWDLHWWPPDFPWFRES